MDPQNKMMDRILLISFIILFFFERSTLAAHGESDESSSHAKPVEIKLLKTEDEFDVRSGTIQFLFASIEGEFKASNGTDDVDHVFKLDLENLCDLKRCVNHLWSLYLHLVPDDQTFIGVHERIFHINGNRDPLTHDELLAEARQQDRLASQASTATAHPDAAARKKRQNEGPPAATTGDDAQVGEFATLGFYGVTSRQHATSRTLQIPPYHLRAQLYYLHVLSPRNDRALILSRKFRVLSFLERAPFIENALPFTPETTLEHQIDEEIKAHVSASRARYYVYERPALETRPAPASRPDWDEAMFLSLDVRRPSMPVQDRTSAVCVNADDGGDGEESQDATTTTTTTNSNNNNNNNGDGNQQQQQEPQLARIRSDACLRPAFSNLTTAFAATPLPACVSDLIWRNYNTPPCYDLSLYASILDSPHMPIPDAMAACPPFGEADCEDGCRHGVITTLIARLAQGATKPKELASHTISRHLVELCAQFTGQEHAQRESCQLGLGVGLGRYFLYGHDADYSKLVDVLELCYNLNHVQDLDQKIVESHHFSISHCTEGVFRAYTREHFHRSKSHPFDRVCDPKLVKENKLKRDEYDQCLKTVFQHQGYDRCTDPSADRCAAQFCATFDTDSPHRANVTRAMQLCRTAVLDRAQTMAEARTDGKPCAFPLMNSHVRLITALPAHVGHSGAEVSAMHAAALLNLTAPDEGTVDPMIYELAYFDINWLDIVAPSVNGKPFGSQIRSTSRVDVDQIRQSLQRRLGVNRQGLSSTGMAPIYYVEVDPRGALLDMSAQLVDTTNGAPHRQRAQQSGFAHGIVQAANPGSHRTDAEASLSPSVSLALGLAVCLLCVAGLVWRVRLRNKAAALKA